MNGSADRGRVSVFIAVALVGVLIVIGLTFDGIGRIRAYQRAANIAAEAARAGGQAINVADAIAGATPAVDEADATAAALAFIDNLDDPTIVDREVSLGQDAGGNESTQFLRVAVTISYDAAMLDFFGFADTFPVRGEATVELVTTTDATS
ncbi:hypothetical protein [Asanoa iriomotensis]|uniref:Flp pilus-assembly TadE/G-like protein n=1 Tax=Asanoa iriomotensis TaxID=234613 RepID=A0ABQ4C4I8_9ACTN|nr:hypothetical protein [Asanoa iriomotensis]GIF57692.1 hypothetical protein Air01nite_37870 [Asanoa iriomotensis]